MSNVKVVQKAESAYVQARTKFDVATLILQKAIDVWEQKPCDETEMAANCALEDQKYAWRKMVEAREAQTASRLAEAAGRG